MSPEEVKDFDEGDDPNLIDNNQSPEAMEQCHSNNSAMSTSSSRRKSFHPQRQLTNAAETDESEENGVSIKERKFLLFYSISISLNNRSNFHLYAQIQKTKEETRFLSCSSTFMLARFFWCTKELTHRKR